MARLIKAIKAAKACIKPVGEGGSTGTFVGNIISNKNLTQKIFRLKILLGLTILFARSLPY
jgi:hypothetical protein